MKYYDKMHYEKELDLFCRCIRANIIIILHKTIYEINSTLLLWTHFKPPSSVCNTGLQTKKASKEPLAPIRKKLRRQIIFLGATE